MIKLINVSKVYKKKNSTYPALQNINLCFEKGKIHGIIGESGAGKSSLLRCMNKLETPTTGEVYVDQVPLSSLSHSKLSSFRERIGMIFQSFNLFSSKRVYDNIAFPLTISGFPKDEIRSRVYELMELVSISHKAHCYPSELSGGEKQRVAIARAIATNPDYLLCDEATSALDPKTTEQVLDLLKKINEDLNITVILITHEMDVVKSICHTITVLDKGQAIYSGNGFDYFVSLEKSYYKDFLLKNFSLEKLSSLGRIIQIQFEGETTKLPIISQLQKDYNLDISILCGQINNIRDIPFGTLILSIPKSQYCEENLISFFNNLNISMEVIL